MVIDVWIVDYLLGLIGTAKWSRSVVKQRQWLEDQHQDVLLAREELPTQSWFQDDLRTR
jgi:hypothetical protein